MGFLFHINENYTDGKKTKYDRVFGGIIIFLLFIIFYTN